MLDVKLSDQTFTFLCSLLSGVLAGVFYTALKVLRKVFSDSKIVTVISDVIFMLVFTVITCLFSIGFTDGFVRYFVVAGEIAGFFFFLLTLGFIIDKLFEGLLKAVRKIKGFFQKNISVFLKKLLKARHKMLYNKVNKKAKSAN